MYASAQPLDFLARTKNPSFPNWKLSVSHPEFPDGHYLYIEAQMVKKKMFRVTFSNQGKVYEVYARHVQQGDLYGFIEVEGLVFGERTTLVVDPGEEQLKSEFSGVKKTHIPFTSIIRIDEVEKEGHGKILQLNAHGEPASASMLPPLKGK